MAIRYFFAICIVFLSFSSVVRASDHAVIQGEKSVITAFRTDLFFNKQAGVLLNKVVIPTLPGDQGVFWKNVSLMLQKARRVYAALGQYLYVSIFSIFSR
ncbi:hypothetical protein V3564_00870 [Bartonella sp. B12(2025)]